MKYSDICAWILGQSGSRLVFHVYTHSLLFRLAKQYVSLNRYTLRSSRKLLFQELVLYGRMRSADDDGSERSPECYLSFLKKAPDIVPFVHELSYDFVHWEQSDKQHLLCLLMMLPNVSVFNIKGCYICRLHKMRPVTHKIKRILLQDCYISTESFSHLIYFTPSLTSLTINGFIPDRPAQTQGVQPPGLPWKVRELDLNFGSFHSPGAFYRWMDAFGHSRLRVLHVTIMYKCFSFLNALIKSSGQALEELKCVAEGIIILSFCCAFVFPLLMQAVRWHRKITLTRTYVKVSPGLNCNVMRYKSRC